MKNVHDYVIGQVMLFAEVLHRFTALGKTSAYGGDLLGCEWLHNLEGLGLICVDVDFIYIKKEFQ